MDFYRPVKFWIWLTTLTSLAGWILSAMGQLNRAGYLLFFAVALAVFFFTKKFSVETKSAVRNLWRKFLRRFRRPLPGAFAVLTLLILLGGILYPPTNHTAFTYRLPRVLNWLAHNGWFWIHTPDWRLNDRACGIEWLAAPLVLFTHSDRGLFLLNFIPFVLLPGLFFSICTQLGVRARAAWHWMWLLPAGYSFLLQAGSAGNDIFPTVYALAAVAFGLRAWKSRQLSDLWYSILAAALLTGAKATNLPLNGMNVDQVGSSDSEQFVKRNIPRITFHSLTQQTWDANILHTKKDQISQINLNDYYQSYCLITAYLAYIDETYAKSDAPSAK